MGGPGSSSITTKIYMQAYERTAITTKLHPPKVWERFVDDVYSILKRTIWKLFLLYQQSSSNYYAYYGGRK